MYSENIEYEQAYKEGYELGFARGFACAMDIAHNDIRQLRMCLRAILEKGEAPAHVMSDEERTTDARSVPHHL